MIKVAIIFHSRSGNTYQMAAAAAAAAVKAGAEAQLYKVPDLPSPMVLDHKAYPELQRRDRGRPGWPCLRTWSRRTPS